MNHVFSLNLCWHLALDYKVKSEYIPYSYWSLYIPFIKARSSTEQRICSVLKKGNLSFYRVAPDVYLSRESKRTLEKMKINHIWDRCMA